MGEALRGAPEDDRGRRGAAARLIAAARALVRRARPLPLWLVLLLAPPARAAAQADAPGGAAVPAAPLRLDAGRFTVVAYPEDATLARALLASAARRDSFPGLPRPRERALIAIAPDARRFRQWTGPGAPEWGAAIALPGQRRIVMQGGRAGSDAGDPIQVLRHELAHLALHEALGDLPTRWFDEGYASWSAGEWSRDEVLEANVALALRGMPSLERLEDGFTHGAGQAEASYALAYRAVAELAALDTARGLSLFLAYWKETGRFDTAVRQAYGMTATAFEKRWQERTRRRYGALALFADLTLTTLFFLAVLLPLYVSRRRRDRRRLDTMRAAEALAERRARDDAALAALLAGPAGAAPGNVPDAPGDEPGAAARPLAPGTSIDSPNPGT